MNNELLEGLAISKDAARWLLDQLPVLESLVQSGGEALDRDTALMILDRSAAMVRASLELTEAVESMAQQGLEAANTLLKVGLTLQADEGRPN